MILTENKREKFCVQVKCCNNRIAIVQKEEELYEN